MSCSLHARRRVRVSDRPSGSENGYGDGSLQLTLRDGHVERDVYETVGPPDGLLGQGVSLGRPPDTMGYTHEEEAEDAQSATGGEVSIVLTRNAADLVAHHVRSPVKSIR